MKNSQLQLMLAAVMALRVTTIAGGKYGGGRTQCKIVSGKANIAAVFFMSDGLALAIIILYAFTHPGGSLHSLSNSGSSNLDSLWHDTEVGLTVGIAIIFWSTGALYKNGCVIGELRLNENTARGPDEFFQDVASSFA